MGLEDIIFKQERIGKQGEHFTIYKIRTMTKNSEDLSLHRLRSKEDPRITRIGKFLRRNGIDELPQIYNIIQGHMRIIGLRAITPEEFETLPKDLQQERMKYKPGLFGIRYAHNPAYNLDEIYSIERDYFAQKEQNPILTDVKMFVKFWYNVVFKNRRSV